MTLSEFLPENDFNVAKPLLVLNGAEEICQVLLACRGQAGWQVAHFREMPPDQPIMEVLMPALLEMLATAALPPADLGGIACVRGPGRFTGIRIVLATALGLSKAAGIPLAGLELPAVLASGSRPILQSDQLIVAARARRDLAYVQLFSHRDDALEADAPTAIMSDEDLAALINGLPNCPCLLGSGVAPCLSKLSGRICRPYFVLPEQYNRPQPGALLSEALRQNYSMEAIDPLYLRISDAEENLSAIAAGRGLAPEEAQKRLRTSLHNVSIE